MAKDGNIIELYDVESLDAIAEDEEEHPTNLEEDDGWKEIILDFSDFPVGGEQQSFTWTELSHYRANGTWDFECSDWERFLLEEEDLKKEKQRKYRR